MIVNTPRQSWWMNDLANDTRRIYIDQEHKNVDGTHSPEGDSVGFWVGDMLIVHTVDIYPNDYFRGQPPTSNQFESVEVWRMVMFDSNREEVLVGDVVRCTFNSPHTVLHLRDARGTVWGFEGAAPTAIISRTPKVDGLTFKPGDRITMIHCPLHDERSGGAIGLIVTKDGTWYRPADGGCRANEANWRKWLEAGHKSKAAAEAATKK